DLRENWLRRPAKPARLRASAPRLHCHPSDPGGHPWPRPEPDDSLRSIVDLRKNWLRRPAEPARLRASTVIVPTRAAILGRAQSLMLKPTREEFRKLALDHTIVPV